MCYSIANVGVKLVFILRQVVAELFFPLRLGSGVGQAARLHEENARRQRSQIHVFSCLLETTET